MERLVGALGAVALTFLLVLGFLALLPAPVQKAVPDTVVGGVVLLVGLLAVRRFVRRSR
ncbi:hypothetical protein [Streptomyces sp. NPDC089799]|uniref:hypothetical protein n=1 Tax=Streptomyces sp. NPDC089799 TaxID=3155066 RepID=UPI00342504A6